MKGTPTYETWCKMRRRCNDAKDDHFKFYGARGISVCEQWRDFLTFLHDMGERPAGMCLGRINNDGNYEPGNCRWETMRQQANNTRSNRRLELDGEIHTMAEWARKLGLTQGALNMRMKAGWDMRKTLTTPPMNNQFRFRSTTTLSVA